MVLEFGFELSAALSLRRKNWKKKKHLLQQLVPTSQTLLILLLQPAIKMKRRSGYPFLCNDILKLIIDLKLQ